MAWDLDPQQVEIIGRNWLVGELIRAGLEVADPVRDNGVALPLVWTQATGTTAAGNRLSLPSAFR